MGTGGGMAALAKLHPGPGLRLTRVEVPGVGPGQVRARVQLAGICGTDGHIYAWDRWAASRIRPPVVLGHEWMGLVDAVGPGVEGIEPGDRVTAEMHFYCGQCRACRAGQPHLCRHLRIGGVDTDGAFAQYVVVPARNVWRLDPSIPDEVAAIMDPLGNAVHTALAFPLSGATVAVTGAGPIGLAAIAVARRAGATAIFVTETSAPRRRLAALMGADRVMDPRDVDAVAVVLEATGGEGVDVLLEMSGHPDAIRQGLRMVRPGGAVAQLGLPPGEVTLELGEQVVMKGLTLKGIHGREIFRTWMQTSELLRGGLDVRPIVTHRLPLEAYEEAFELLASGQCGKIVLEIPGS
ncbi:L-threonine 3-dehydrogenase [Geochorda subterranea]|uniref:L-threonine 3-dehydrogenase n=1 Tax=Geochorda subterranea TaxID=3109564 RepID=A0ABZ1BN47_9FIRM|nr:L-threonine 3-dehydrogenase [Limnochorda sp. LNt]WRP14207.1 L-threonine 3-dehydrogenase [Limnochorda sp. LNt]